MQQITFEHFRDKRVLMIFLQEKKNKTELDKFNSYQTLHFIQK